MTNVERRVEVLARRMRQRTKRDGTPLPGYEQSVAQIKAELGVLSNYDGGDENGD